jgi:hypothetical protein
MLTIQHCEELIHRAYLLALSAKAGVNVEIGKSEFDYGMDGFFSKIVTDKNKKYHETGTLIQFQLKASKNIKINEKEKSVSYQLDVNSYNKLVSCSFPTLLILLSLPKEESQWITISTENLILRKCCYWQYFPNDYKIVDDKKTVTIKFSSENIFTPEIINNELEKLDEIGRNFFRKL